MQQEDTKSTTTHGACSSAEMPVKSEYEMSQNSGSLQPPFSRPDTSASTVSVRDSAGNISPEISQIVDDIRERTANDEVKPANSTATASLGLPELHSAAHWSSSRASLKSNASYCSKLNDDASFQALSAQPLNPVLIKPLVRLSLDVGDKTSNLRRRTASECSEKEANDTQADQSSPSAKKSPAELLLQQINRSNRAQTVVLFICFVSYVMLSISLFAQGFFLVGTMEHKCVAPVSAEQVKTNVTDSGTDQCSVTTDAGVEPCTAWNYSSPYYTQTMLAEFDLVCSRAYGISLFQSLAFWGCTFGVLACGPLADRFGRRTVVLFATPACFVASLLIAMTPSYGALLLVLRFLAGFLTDADYQVKYTIVMEIASDQKRYKFGPLMRAGWPVAAIIASALAWWLQEYSWRTLQWACVCLACISLPMALLVPESPAWLCAKAQDDAARGAEQAARKKANSALKVMKRMARINNTSVDEQQWRSLLTDMTATAATRLNDGERSHDENDHSHGAELRRRRSSSTSPLSAQQATPMLLAKAAQSPSTTTTITKTIPSLRGNSAVAAAAAVAQPPTSLVSSFLTRPLLRSTILLVIIQSALTAAWNGNAFYATGFFPGSPFTTLACLSIAQVIANYSLLYVIEWCGSTRRTILILISACVVIYGLLTGLIGIDGWLEQSEVMPREVINYFYVFLAVLICCCTAAAASTTYVYIGETYPVRVRQTGFGICKGVANIFGGMAPFAANLLNVVWRPLPALLFWACCAIGLLAAVLLPTISLMNNSSGAAADEEERVEKRSSLTANEQKQKK